MKLSNILAVAALSLYLVGLCLSESVSPCGIQLSTMTSPISINDGYSPAICFQLNDLKAGQYTFKVWALETITPLPDFPDCVGPQGGGLCEKTFQIDNTGANFANVHQAIILENLELFTFDQFHFVTRLFLNNNEVGFFEFYIPTTGARPPVLNQIANQVSAVNRQLTIQASANDNGNGGVTFQLMNAPQGAKINANTGAITFTPKAKGVYTMIVSAVQGELFDSQLVTVDVRTEVGVPTPLPKNSRVPTAVLEDVSQDGLCRWFVTLVLKGFEPLTKLTTVSYGSRTECDTKTAEKYYWTAPRLISVDEQGAGEFTFIHRDWGTYTYVFTDVKNRTASVHFNVAKKANSTIAA